MLDFGLCVAPFVYKKRNCRFAIDFFSVSDFVPKIPSELLHYKGFSYNKDKQRVSFLLKDGFQKRCTLSNKIITIDPDAEKFLKTFLEFNQSVKEEVEYYVFDEDGLDIPLFPGKTDIEKELGFNPKDLLFPGIIAVGLYLVLKNK